MRRWYKYILVFLFFLPLIAPAGNGFVADTLEYKGVNYQRKLFFNNPSPDTGGFSIQQILVNGDTVREELRSNTVTLHLDRVPLEREDSLRIHVVFLEGYMPHLVNPEGLLPPNDFIFTYMRVRNENLIWRVAGVIGYRPFVVEQYRWERWVDIEEVPVYDSLAGGTYEYNLRPHYGANRYRVIKVNALGQTVVSREQSVRAYNVPQPEMVSTWVRERLEFTEVTRYEIYDMDWNLIKKGRDRYINVSDLPRGRYRINYCNTTDTFRKR